MPGYYLRIEGVNLSNFVFDTQDLSTIRGGGLMLLRAVDHALEQLKLGFPSINFCTVTRGASSSIFQFDASDEGKAVSIRQAAEGILKGEMHSGSTLSSLKHATFVVSLQRSHSTPQEDRFGLDREYLLAQNRWQQMQSPSLAVPAQSNHDWLNWWQCEIDRVRPAVNAMPGPEGTEKVSSSVYTRRVYGRQQKHRFYRELTELGEDVIKLEEFAHDFEELSSDSNRNDNLNRKIAVLYLDGNGFGAIQDQYCQTISDQQKFDKTVQEYRKGFLAGLLEHVITVGEKDWITYHSNARGRYRMETLLWGGDEIIWVLPAWQGWRVLSLFYQESRDWKFSPDSKDVDPEKGVRLTHAGGLVFCHHSAPISRINDLAKNLAEQAKEKAKLTGDRHQNLFGYQVLESFDQAGQSFKTFRMKLTPIGLKPEDLIMPGKLMDAFDQALRQFKASDDFPRRKLHEIGRLLFKDLDGATKAIEQLKADLPANDRDVLTRIESEWQGNGGSLSSLWLHFLELWDYTGN